LEALDHLLFFAGVLIASVFMALLEIQIEGPHGWAEKLPTWRLDSKLARTLFGGRPITGYHFYFHLFVLTLVHLPYAFGVPFGWAVEFRIISFLIFFWIFEDFIWFLLNPAYGLGRFRKEHIPWHAPNWWWIMPRDYWIMLPCAIALYLVALYF
jgi:hypothetical protein